MSLNDTILNFTSIAPQLDQYRPHLHRAMMEAAIGHALPELNEPGWTELGDSEDEQITRLDRRYVREEALRHYHSDPTARHLVQLQSAYVFSRGVSVRAEDKDVDKLLRKFWKDVRNRSSLTRAKSQWRLSRNIQINGEIFFMFFTSKETGKVIIREVDPSEIKKIVSVPGDRDMPLYFVREYSRTDGKRVTERILDYRVVNTGEIIDELKVYDTDRAEVCMMHIISNELSGRGISELSASIPWLKALRGFMEDRATLSLALATFAFKQKVKGNKDSVNRMIRQWESYQTDENRYGTEDGRDRRQGGNTYIENDSSSLEQFQIDSKANNAYQDMRMFRQQAGIGKSTFEHYLGDPSTGNLATATAMELPMLKMFEFWQQFWNDEFEEIIDFVIRQGIRFGEIRTADYVVEQSLGSEISYWELDDKQDKLEFEILFPPIIQRDLGMWSSGLQQIASAQANLGQEIVPPEQMASTALRLLGFTSESSTIIKEMKEREFKLQTPTREDKLAAIADQKAEQEAKNEPDDEDPKPGAPKPDEKEEDKEENDVKEASVGSALTASKATAVKRITKEEMDEAVDKWLDLPPLSDLAKELGIPASELSNA